jgi:replicative DNA helicase
VAEEPQYDTAAEEAVISAMLRSREAIWDAVEVLNDPADFWNPKHELIARALVALANRNEPTDVISAVAELERTGDLLKAGGAAYLHSLTSVLTPTSTAGYHAQIIRERAVRRRLYEAGVRITQMGKSTESDAMTLVESAQSELESVAKNVRVDAHPVGRTLDAVIDGLEQKPEYLPTGFDSIDRIIGGLAAGNLIIIGARPGEGKSIVGLQMAARLAREGMVVYCSLEMSEEELQLRLISQFGEVHMKSLRNHALNDEQRRRVGFAKHLMKDAPIFVDDASSTLTGIRSFIRSVSRKGNLTGVVIDYLQLMEGARPNQSRQEFVGDMSRQLKKLAKTLQVPVIAMSQLNRGVEGRTSRGSSRTPMLQDLRESGSIEQDADVVLLLDHDRKKPQYLNIAVAKNRHGELGTVQLIWQGQFARLKDQEWSPFGQTTLDGTEVA